MAPPGPRHCRRLAAVSPRCIAAAGRAAVAGRAAIAPLGRAIGHPGNGILGSLHLTPFLERVISGGGYSTKKRPPLRRGQLKRRIVRTISKLVVPSSADDGGRPSQAAAVDRRFIREPSDN
uniref:Uncharacterized protein n=1 Tax=Setaria viridis TaxID=4556 RepID=A0A4U6VEN5_SETVI|nr:hypothetical protein SEVIR_3G217500v2 [Setaria viridis]